MKLLKQGLRFNLVITIFCILILFTAKPAQAAESVNWFDWPTVGQAVQLDKEWQIHLSQPVDGLTVNATNISILDAEGVPCDITPRLAPDGKTILIKPERLYHTGTSYRLLINNLKSVSGKALGKPVSFGFQTVDDGGNTATLYDTILNAFDLVESSVDVSKFAKTPDEVFAVLNQVLREHPESKFYYDKATVNYVEESGFAKTLKLNYRYDLLTIEAMRTALNTKIKEIVQTETLSVMSSFEKELALHDYVVTHTVYEIDNLNNNSLPHLAYTGYGVLVNGSGVCEGYAQAMQLLLNEVGIECRMVIGEGHGESHAWNMVKIEGEYYHLDTTWDDPIPDGGDRVNYAYFNLPDRLMGKDHVWKIADYPACTDLAQNYYYQNGWYTKNYVEFYVLLQQAVAERRTEFTCMAESYDPAVYDLTQTLRQVGFQGSYRYQVNAALGIVTLSNITYIDE